LPILVHLLICLYLHIVSIFQISTQSCEVQWSSRREAVIKSCQTNPILLKKPFLKSKQMYNEELMFNIVHIKNLNLNWCLVPKVASTSISSFILPHLPQTNTTKDWTTVQDEVWQRAGHLHLSEYLSNNDTHSFLITRHPFARIASAFRNKLENRTRSLDGEYFYQQYSKKTRSISNGVTAN
jgi:hypothetical protein